MMHTVYRSRWELSTFPQSSENYLIHLVTSLQINYYLQQTPVLDMHSRSILGILLYDLDL